MIVQTSPSPPPLSLSLSLCVCVCVCLPLPLHSCRVRLLVYYTICYIICCERRTPRSQTSQGPLTALSRCPYTATALQRCRTSPLRFPPLEALHPRARTLNSVHGALSLGEIYGSLCRAFISAAWTAPTSCRSTKKTPAWRPFTSTSSAYLDQTQSEGGGREGERGGGRQRKRVPAPTNASLSQMTVRW